MPDNLFWRVRIAATVAVWFALVYGGADWITAKRAATNPLPSVAIPLDAAIPFWPAAAWVYLTITPLLLLPLVVMQDQLRIRALAAVLCGEIAIAGLIYLTFPVDQSRIPDVALPAAMRLADQINLTYNSLPSLHVALSLTAAGALLQTGRPVRNLGLAFWAFLIAGSTLVTHQHFIADLIAGVILAALGLIAFWRLGQVKEAGA